MLNLTNSQEPEPGVFGSLEEPEPESLEKKQESEPEPLGKKIRSRSRLKKKSGARAGAAKKFAGSPALVKMLHTDIRHTDIQTYRPSDEAGPRGAFAPKNVRCLMCL